MNLKNPDLDLIRRIHPECRFYGFKICFWIRKSGFGVSQKTHPMFPCCQLWGERAGQNIRHSERHKMQLKCCSHEEQKGQRAMCMLAMEIRRLAPISQWTIIISLISSPINKSQSSRSLPVWEQIRDSNYTSSRFACELIGALSSQDEFVDDDERRRVRSGSWTSSKVGNTNV